MSVFKSTLSTKPIHELFFLNEQTQSLVVKLGVRLPVNESLYGPCREEILRYIDQEGVKEILFDLSNLHVLPSSALGLIASVSQCQAKVIVVNASESAHEDFMMTGLYQMLELEPLNPPSPK